MLMKIAVMSDIHGNNVALKAVLKDLARQGQIDRVIVAGDFFARSMAVAQGSLLTGERRPLSAGEFLFGGLQCRGLAG